MENEDVLTILLTFARDANRVGRDAIRIAHEGGNLLLSSTVCFTEQCHYKEKLNVGHLGIKGLKCIEVGHA